MSSPSPANPELKTYRGNCHCGAFKFHVTSPPLTSAAVCNCSSCSKKGSLWIYPNEPDVVVDRDELGLTEYEFEPKVMVHSFCPRCGTALMSKWKGRKQGGSIGVNARAFNNLNLRLLTIKKINGKRHDPQYIPPPFTGILPVIDAEEEKDGLQLFTGACHCGAVTIALKSKPLTEIRVSKGDCSICQRNAYILIHVPLSAVAISGQENITEYEFALRFQAHCFCRICGVPVFLRVHDPAEEGNEAWSTEKREAVRGNFGMVPVNVRVLEGVDRKVLKMESVEEGRAGYVVD